MASKLSFGGIYTSVPDAYSRVDRAGLAVLTPQATGVVMMIGETEGGGAGAGLTIDEFTRPQAVIDEYRAGDLREQALICFDPSGDGRMGGARKVQAIKVNPAVASSAVLANADGNALTVTSQDYGLFTSQINVEKGAGSLVGNAFTENFESTSNLYDDIGGTAWFQLLYTPGSYTTMTASVGVDASGNPDKVTASATLVEAAGEATGVAFTAGDLATIVYNAANTGDTLTVYGINSDGEVASEAVVLAVPAGQDTVTRWSRITAAVCSAAIAVGNLTIEDAGAAVDLTIVVGQTDVGFQTVTDVPVANRPIALVSDGATTDPIVLRGRDIAGNAQSEAVALAGLVPVASTKSWSEIDSVEIGGLPAARNLTLTATAADVRVTGTTGAATSNTFSATQVGAFVSGDRARIVSSAGADTSLAVQIWGLDVSGDYQTETITTDATLGTTPVLGTLTWSAVYGATLTGGVYPTGTISITDEVPTTVQSIVPERLDSGLLAGATRGIHETTIPVSGTTITLVADGATTRSVMVEGLDTSNATQREVIALTGGVAVTTTGMWNRVDKIYTGDVEAARTVTVGSTYTITGGYTTIQQLADAYNARDGFTATVVTSAASTDLISELDIKVVAGGAIARNIYAITVDFKADLTEMIRRVNAQSSLVTLTRPDGATTVPADTGLAVWLTGGSEGVTTFAHWTAAFAKAATTDEPQSFVVLTSNAAVHAALDAHLLQREATLKREADGKVGLPAGTTKANIATLIRAINSRRMSAYAQEIQRYNSNGVLTWFAPFTLATIAAGMQAGAPTPGEPLTRKYIKAVDVRQDSSWDPINDADDMLDAGLCFVEDVSGVGYRFVRGITTYLADDNLGNTEQSTNTAVNVFVRNLRSFVDERIGEVNFAGTLGSVEAIVKQALVLAVAEGWITAYEAPSYVQTADKIEISITVEPPIPFNFAPISVHLSLDVD